MSRFFGTASDSESDTSSEEETIPRDGTLHASSFPRKEIETKRVVRSLADKQKKKLQYIINQIANFQKIRDCVSLLHAFGEMINVYEKYADNGSDNMFFRCLNDIDAFVSEVWDDKLFRQNMTKLASKSLVALRQKVRKYIKLYGQDIKQARSLAASDSEQSGSDEEPIIVEEHGVSDDSSSWSDSESPELYEKDQKLLQRDYFLKKNAIVADENVVRQEKKRVKKIEDPKYEDEKGWQTIKNCGAPHEWINIMKDDFTVTSVTKVLSVLSVSKAKRHSCGKQKVKLLSDLLSSVENHNLGMPIVLKVRLAIASAVFDHNLNFSNAMKLESWEQIVACMAALAESLEKVDFDVRPNVEDEALENPPFLIRGCLVSLTERLDEEFNKVLRDFDPYGDDYKNCLKNETTVTTIIDQVLKYTEERGSASAICRIYLCKINHLYYKLDESAFNLEKEQNEVGSILEMDRLCKYVYRNDTSNILRTRSILSQIYHSALHDRWILARDLMLMSHLQDTIQHSDPQTQMLYNRAMTQLGLCAFRAGLINDANSCLADLLTNGRLRELLGQGVSSFRLSERSREQELRDRQFQVPFHMHIPLELVECVYLICAMIIDIPIPYQVDARRRIISKPLYVILRLIGKQCLLGPPETIKDHIVVACKALKLGHWQACINYLINPKMDVKVWSKIRPKSTPVEEILQKNIKKASLLMYVLSFGPTYDSMKISRLAEMFHMDPSEVRQHLASSITSEEFKASLDEPTDTAIYRKSRHTVLHALSTQMIEKVTLLLDANERCCRVGQRGTGGDPKY